MHGFTDRERSGYSFIQADAGWRRSLKEMDHAPTLDKMNDEGGRGGGFPQFSTTFLPVWNVALLPG